MKDDSLKTVQEELLLTKRRSSEADYYTVKNGGRITDKFRFQTDIAYHQKYTIHWIETQHARFEYVTNIQPNKDTKPAPG